MPVHPHLPPPSPITVTKHPPQRMPLPARTTRNTPPPIPPLHRLCRRHTPHRAPRFLVLLQDSTLLPTRPHLRLRVRCHHRRSGRRAFQPHQVHRKESTHKRGDNRLPAGRCGKYRSRIRHLFRTRRPNDRLPAFRITGKYCGRLPNGRGQGCRAITRHPCPLIPRRVTPEVSGQARHLLT
mgnify:CR=1 FL=1